MSVLRSKPSDSLYAISPICCTNLAVSKIDSITPRSSNTYMTCWKGYIKGQKQNPSDLTSLGKSISSKKRRYKVGRLESTELNMVGPSCNSHIQESGVGEIWVSRPTWNTSWVLCGRTTLTNYLHTYLQR